MLSKPSVFSLMMQSKTYSNYNIGKPVTDRLTSSGFSEGNWNKLKDLDSLMDFLPIDIGHYFRTSRKEAKLPTCSFV
jgi:hypothetical protein